MGNKKQARDARPSVWLLWEDDKASHEVALPLEKIEDEIAAITTARVPVNFGNARNFKVAFRWQFPIAKSGPLAGYVDIVEEIVNAEPYLAVRDDRDALDALPKIGSSSKRLHLEPLTAG